MSTDLDFWGLLFDSFFDASAQNRQKNGAPTFQVVDGIAPGAATIAEAALNAVHPGTAIGSDIQASFEKKVLAPLNLTAKVRGAELPGMEGASKTAEKKTAALTKVADKNEFEQLFRQKLSNLIAEFQRTHNRQPNSQELQKLKEQARKEAEAATSVKLGEFKGPALSFSLSDLTNFFFNPAGTINTLTEKSFGAKPSKKWAVLAGTSAAAAAGILTRRLTRNSNIDTKGDAIMIAAAEPTKRTHVFAGNLMLGKVISDEQKTKMIFDNALDMVARAENFDVTQAPGGRQQVQVNQDKRLVARYGADAIVEYAKRNNLDVSDILADWQAHAHNIEQILHSDSFRRRYVKKQDRQDFQNALARVNSVDVLESTWVAPDTTIDGVAGTFSAKELLQEYSAYKTNRRAWLGRKITGDHAYHEKLDSIIDNTVNLYAQAAEDKGDTAKASTYRNALIESKKRMREMTFADKLYWYKLKWDVYKEKLGPSAGFGLLTGDFFLAAAGASLVENDLVPAIHILSEPVTNAVLSSMGGTLPADLHGLFVGALNRRGDNLPAFLSAHANLSGFAGQLSALSKGLLVAAGYDNKAIVKTFGIYKPVPPISKKANKMQQMSYLIGTLHPYQLIKAFLDGSLGDRLVYIGLRFGKVTDFDQLRRYEKLLLRIGLRLNNSFLYSRFRILAMHLKFVANFPTILAQAGFNLYKKQLFRLAGGAKGLATAGFRWFGRTRLGQTAVFQLIKRGVEAVLGFITGGVSEVFFKIYGAINFLTGGALDKFVFKGLLYSMWFIFGLLLLTNSGIITLGAGLKSLVYNPIKVAPNPGGGTIYEGYGPEDLNTEVFEQYATSAASAAGVPKDMAQLSSKAGGAFASLSAIGHSLGRSACPVTGSITQMWGPGASDYHRRHQAIDYGGNGGSVVYALVSGTATCLKGNRDTRIKCKDGSYAGDAVVIKGEGVTVYYLHVQCLYDTPWEVQAGDSIGRVITKDKVKFVRDPVTGKLKSNCWTGPHLHIHLDPPDGAALFCTIKEKCGRVAFSSPDGKVNVKCSD